MPTTTPDLQALKAQAAETEDAIETAFDAHQSAIDRLGEAVADGRDVAQARAEATEARTRYHELLAARPIIEKRIRDAKRAESALRNADAMAKLLTLADEREEVSAELSGALTTVSDLVDRHVAIGKTMTEALRTADLPQVTAGSSTRFSSSLGQVLESSFRRVREILEHEPELLARLR